MFLGGLIIVILIYGAKKIVLFPINLQPHWSLCVFVNVLNLNQYVRVMTDAENSEIPFFMLLDSLGLHDPKSIHINMWKWLQNEYSKTNGDVDVRFFFEIPMVCPKGIVMLTMMSSFICCFGMMLSISMLSKVI